MLAGFVCLLLGGCGSKASTTEEASPTATPTNPPAATSTETFAATPSVTAGTTTTPTAVTATPTSTAPTVYELTQDSRLRFGDGDAEVANGSMMVTPCLSPNTFYAYRIDSIAIRAASVEIRSASDRGILEAVTLNPEDLAVNLSAAVSVNGEPDHLSGSGPLDEARSGDTLDLKLNSALVALHLKAKRIGPAYELGSFDGWCFP